MTDKPQPDDYLEATDENGSLAAAEVMDRLSERLKAASAAGTMLECRAAAEAVVEIAKEADRPESVINQALSTAGNVAQQSATSKGQITDPIQAASEDLRLELAKDSVGLDDGYGFDKYLEKNLIRVEKVESTDHHSDPKYRWVFDDIDPVETAKGVPYEWYQFWKVLAEATAGVKKLEPEFASEEIGDPESDPRYDELSIGPKSRPWAVDNYVTCLNDLISERLEHVEITGPRTEVWESVCRVIGRSRAVTDLKSAIDNKAIHAMYDDGELVELWVPTTTINSQCSEHDVEPRALQSEVVARGADSDALPGRSVAEPQTAGNKTQRYWRFDASHEAIPEPDEIVDELTKSTDSLDSLEWGDVDE